MSKKIKNLAETVKIEQGFPGTYQWTGGTSYYLNGESNQGDIHFSVSSNPEDDFTAFHITPQVLTGTNVGIWFQEATWSNNNTKNLPSHKNEEWETWWAANQLKVEAAAVDFWVNLNK